MPSITKISQQKRSPNRQSIYLDGAFAFGCNVNVIAKFHLREGMMVSPDQLIEIQQGEVRQECFDAAMRSLESRLHSRSELKKKLMRKEWGAAVIDAVLDDLQRMGYVDDSRFAKNKALSAVQYKHHGRRRAFMELLRSGVKGDVANVALDEVYAQTDSMAIARELASKQVKRLSRLEPAVARRRLIGMLLRRGYDYDAIKPVVDDVLGNLGQTDA